MCTLEKAVSNAPLGRPMGPSMPHPSHRLPQRWNYEDSKEEEIHLAWFWPPTPTKSDTPPNLGNAPSEMADSDGVKHFLVDQPTEQLRGHTPMGPMSTSQPKDTQSDTTPTQTEELLDPPEDDTEPVECHRSIEKRSTKEVNLWHSGAKFWGGCTHVAER